MKLFVYAASDYVSADFCILSAKVNLFLGMKGTAMAFPPLIFTCEQDSILVFLKNSLPFSFLVLNMVFFCMSALMGYAIIPFARSSSTTPLLAIAAPSGDICCCSGDCSLYSI